jgi:UDP-N-acetylglucosamine 2-epimerase (non-hydrolysing)
MKRKIMLVFGTRPEAIKMAPLYHALKAESTRFDTLACVTAQHRQMLDQVLQAFDVKPDVELNLMKSGQDLFDLTSSVLLGMRSVLQAHRPDVLLVHGDTTTTLASSLAAFYSGVKVGHVEAGLRTYNLQAPFPEELNRQVATKLSHWHFAPTVISRENLLNEGVSPERIGVTGNTVVDALFWIVDRIDRNPALRASLTTRLDEMLSFDWRTSKYVLITGHRRENFGDGFLQICRALKDLAGRYSDVHFVYPVHLNPNVQVPVKQMLADVSNIHLIEPLDYQPFVLLLKNCYIVLTDSGGIQEEAPSLGKPVLVMREVTERPEAVSAGTVRLVGANRERIFAGVSELLDDEDTYRHMARAHNPYGDGAASAKIIEFLGSDG